MRLIDIDAINPMRCPKSIAEMREWFDEIPTAYDIDKVVDQLVDFKNTEQCPWNRAKCDEYATCEQCKLSYTIELVKKGGAV